MSRIARSTLPAIVALAFAGASAALHAAPLAYVASDGNDARGGGGRCTLAAPCRTFQVAHDSVDAGGQVIALDSADYGPLLVTKSVSIVGGPGSVTGINAATGNAVTIATAGVDVALRNLYLTGSGGARGVEMSAGHSLAIENCVVTRFAGDGVHVAAGQGVAIVDSAVRNNGGDGAYLGSGNSTIVRSQFLQNAGSGVDLEGLTLGAWATVTDSVASGNGNRGFSARSVSGSARMALFHATASRNAGAGFHNEKVSGFADAKMTIAESTSTLNGIGLFNSVTGLITTSLVYSAGNNVVMFNVVDVDGIVAALPVQ